MFGDLPPPLVSPPGSQNNDNNNGWPSPHTLANANAGATPWRGAVSDPVIPGGFGAGTPSHLPTPAPLHPMQYTLAQSRRSLSHGRAGRGGGGGRRNLSRSGSTSHHHPHLRNFAHSPISAIGAPDPFSIPAAAFDQQGFVPSIGGFGALPPTGFNPPYPSPWGDPPPLGMGTPGGMRGMVPVPWYGGGDGGGGAATPHPHPHQHEQDTEDGEEDAYDDGPPPLGFGGGWMGGDPWESPSPGGGGGGWGAFGQMTRSPGAGSGSGSTPSPSQSMLNGFASGPRNQYSRPEEWRSDFNMSRPGALTRVLSLGRGGGKGKGSGFSFFGKPSVHWTLDAKSASCSWDIRQPPDALLVLPSQRPLSFLELQEGALTPPPLRMKLTHPLLPWTIHVTASPGAVITVAHLLSTIYMELTCRQVFQRDFWNDDVSEGERKRIYEAWVVRCNGDRSVAEQGIKRVDFLGGRWVFEGIRRAGEGWEMKLKEGRGRV